MDRTAPHALTTTVAPRAPRTPAETGLPFAFVAGLTLRHLLSGGEARQDELAVRLRLPLSVIDPILAFLRAEKLAEVPRRGSFEADVTWALTEAGRVRAQDATARCGYVGPAPVALDAYCARVALQAQHGRHVDRARLRSGLGDAVVHDALVDALGAALNSDRALFLYGPSGTGKTYIAERLGNVMHDAILVPHAILVDGEVIQVFDPLVHRPMSETGPADSLERAAPTDDRWVSVRRPVTAVGGELTLEMLELQFEAVSRFYVAPPQVKANNGMLVIDDLGRQRVAARELMNRWIVPLDRRVDHLALHTGGKFLLPFDVKVVFSSNLPPESLGDPAFSRRVGYKLRLEAMDAPRYREVIRQACGRAGVPFDDAAAEHLIAGLHARHRVPLYPTIPFDVIGRLRDRADYLGEAPVLDPEGLDWAWSVYFSADGSSGRAPTLRDETR
ncbi:MAG: hypothetical protein RJA99_4844 [Pseudomonadota bacterium]|jgi:hypothetical protein